MDYRLLGAILLVISLGVFLTISQQGAGYQPQKFYTYLVTGPDRIGEYQVVVAWRSPDPTAVHGPYVDQNNGIVVFQFDLPYAPDINEVSIVYPSGQVGTLVFSPPKRVPHAVVVVDISPGDVGYVFVCRDGSVYMGADQVARYLGLCSGPFEVSPGSVQELDGEEALP